MLRSTPDDAKFWHIGARTTKTPTAEEVMTGSNKINVNDLRSLHTPEEYSLDIIKGYANVINMWSRSHRKTEDSYSTYT